MIVTMIAMTMVKLAFVEIINVISVRNGFMPATSMPTITRCGSTISRVLRAYLNNMFIVVLIVKGMQMPIMNVVDVPLVLNGGVSTVRTMNMRMAGMNIMTHVCILSKQAISHTIAT